LGAKGSPLQLILSSVYHMDAPTGNISFKEAKKMLKNPLVTKGIPLAYGDSYRSYRIVGTDAQLSKHYDLKLQKGEEWQHDFEVTVGVKVANDLNLKVGDTFFGSHGLLDDDHVHDQHPYKVVGIYEGSNSVADQLILTGLNSVWGVHDHPASKKKPKKEAAHKHDDDHNHDHEGHDHNHEGDDHNHEGDDHKHEEHNHDDEGHDHQEEDKDITAMLVKFRSPMGLMQIPRMVNQQTKMQAALPSIEVNRLFDLLGVGIETLRMLALAIMLVSGISVFISLYNSLKERKYEMALMRTMGASRYFLFGLVVLEGLILGIIGFILGIILSRIGLLIVSRLMESNYHYALQSWSLEKGELWLLLITLSIGFLAALLPAIQAYRTNISEALSDG